MQVLGLMVPFARDWPETQKYGDIETINPPAPDKIAGRAFLINRKVCPGKADEAIFRVADRWRSAGKLLEKHHFGAEDLSGMREEYRPKWLPQVLARIERLAQRVTRPGHSSTSRPPPLPLPRPDRGAQQSAPAGALETVPAGDSAGATNAAGRTDSAR